MILGKVRLRNTLITIVGTVLVPSILHVLLPYLILQRTSGWSIPRLGLIESLSFLAAAGGLSMVVWVAVLFVRRGKGTAMPLLPPTEFVPLGPYRYVRNPMYLGLLVVVLAEAVAFRSTGLLVYACLLWLATHSYVILVEEPGLTRRFGDRYEAYRSETPRWIPRRPRREGS